MEKVTVIKATEQEIIELIQSRFGVEYDSIVGAEELGNRDWCVDVSLADDFEKEDIKNSDTHNFMTRSYLNVLCSENLLEAGEYIIDCTW